MHIYLGDKEGVKERGGGGKERRREVREGGEGRWEVGGGRGGDGGRQGGRRGRGRVEVGYKS